MLRQLCAVPTVEKRRGGSRTSYPSTEMRICTLLSFGVILTSSSICPFASPGLDVTANFMYVKQKEIMILGPEADLRQRGGERLRYFLAVRITHPQ